MGVIDPLDEQLTEYANNEFDLNIDKAAVSRVNGATNLGAGGIGVLISTHAVAAGGSVITAVGVATATAFLSGYAIGRGVDKLFNGAITRKGADVLCRVTQNC